MAGKIKIPLLLITLASFIVLGGELYYENYRANRFIQEWTDDFDYRLANLRYKINEKIVAQELQQYLLVKGLAEEQLIALSRFHPLIAGVALLDQNGHILNQRDIKIRPSSLLVQIQKIEKGVNSLKFITADGIFYLYKVRSFYDQALGYFAVRVELPLLSTKGFLIFDKIKEELTALPADLISIEEKEHFRQTDAKTVGEDGFKRLSLGNYRFLLFYWQAQQLYVATEFPQKPIFALFGFYFVLISLFTMLVHLAVSNKERLDKFSGLTKRQELENLLKSQKDTIAIVSKNMEELKQSFKIGATEAHLFQNAEKSVMARVIDKEEEISDEQDPGQQSREDLFTYEPAVQTDENLEDRHTLELKPLKREFIFLDPFEKPLGRSSVSIEESRKKIHQDVRARVFDNELQQLISGLKSKSPKKNHQGSGEVLERLRDFQKHLKEPNINALLQHLNEVYFDNFTIEEHQYIMNLLTRFLGADNMALLVFNTHLGCYETYLSHNLPFKIQQNLYILKNDPYFQFDFKGIQEYVFSAEEKDQPFFKKRFNPEFAAGLLKAKILPLQKFNIDAFYLALYQKNIRQIIKDSDIENFLKDIAPAISALDLETPFFNVNNLGQEIIKEIKRASSLGYNTVQVLHIYTRETFDIHKNREICEYFNNQLDQTERIIYATPNHFVFLLKDFPEQSVFDYFDRNDYQYKVKFYRYPEQGKNYIRYI